MAQTRDELLTHARRMGIGEDLLADDALKADIEAAVAQQQQVEAEIANAPQIAVSRLIAQATEFFPGWHVGDAAGALTHLGLDTEMTVDEARTAIDAWRNSVVQEVEVA